MTPNLSNITIPVQSDSKFTSSQNGTINKNGNLQRFKQDINTYERDFFLDADEEDYSERIPSLGTCLSERCQNGCCSTKLLKKRIPILQWLPNYPRRYLFEDIVAGLTVGLTVIPQGIAYAVVASLAPQYGLYSAFMGCFVYFVFGSCKDVSIGPTAIMSLMVQVHVSNLGPAFAILSAFLAGCTILLLGLLNLGECVS